MAEDQLEQLKMGRIKLSSAQVHGLNDLTLKVAVAQACVNAYMGGIIAGLGVTDFQDAHVIGAELAFLTPGAEEPKPSEPSE